MTPLVPTTVRQAAWASVAAGLLGTGVAAGGRAPTDAPAALLDPVFADHAVLQRDRPLPIRGAARPGARIVVRLGTRSASTTAMADGRWSLQLPAHSAATSLVLEVTTSDGAVQRVRDVAVGDVILCSGQSNMEWSMRQSAGGEAALAQAADPLLRIATVPQRAATTPLPGLAAPLDWAPSTPASARDFSAVCWFMGARLRQELKVPIGLIDASFGGSSIQAWLSPAALAQAGDPEARDLLALYNRAPAAANLLWGERWKRWWINNASGTDTPWLDVGERGWTAVPAMTKWEDWPRPVFADWNGLVWYRTTVTLTAAQAAQAATLDVGGFDEVDQSWINGRAVGTGAMDDPRVYPIPAGTLRAGANLLTVAVVDTWGEGGPIGPAERRALTLADGTRVPLSGPWQYRKLDHPRPRPPRAPWYPASGQGVLHNGMIAPLGAFPVRAMAWYQGESNSEDRLAYGDRLRALIADRRGQFGAALPVLVVQLANYGKVPAEPVESDWAAVREAQRRLAVADSKAALTVTIDVGDPADIHPLDKRTVGERLAANALVVAYGRPGARNGPQPTRADRRSGSIVVRFDGVTGALRGTGASFELCGADPGTCRRVAATLGARAITLPAGHTDVRVRYCWGDAPVCDVRDDRTPISPFEIAVM
jgi:sialate O-acetylesterase